MLNVSKEQWQDILNILVEKNESPNTDRFKKRFMDALYVKGVNKFVVDGNMGGGAQIIHSQSSVKVVFLHKHSTPNRIELKRELDLAIQEVVKDCPQLSYAEMLGL